MNERNELILEVESVLKIADELQEKVYSVYEENKDYITQDKYDISAIVNDKDALRYKRQTYLKIILIDTSGLDKSRIKKILETRKEMLQRRLKDVTIKNIGTVLNTLRELYNDILIDFERNRI